MTTIKVSYTSKELKIPVKYKMSKTYSYTIGKMVTRNLTMGQQEYKIRTILNNKAEACNE